MCDPWVLLPKSRHRKTITQMSDCAFVRPAVRWLEGCGRGMKPVRMRSSTQFVEGYYLYCLLCCRLLISLLGDIHNISLIGMLNENSTSHNSNCPIKAKLKARMFQDYTIVTSGCLFLELNFIIKSSSEMAFVELFLYFL